LDMLEMILAHCRLMAVLFSRNPRTYGGHREHTGRAVSTERPRAPTRRISAFAARKSHRTDWIPFFWHGKRRDHLPNVERVAAMTKRCVSFG
jgi:hypothetical protein